MAEWTTLNQCPIHVVEIVVCPKMKVHMIGARTVQYYITPFQQPSIFKRNNYIYANGLANFKILCLFF